MFEGSKEEGTEVYKTHSFYIPARMLIALRNYVEKGYPVGHFLTAVLTNDLAEACARGDDENLRNLPAYATYLFNEVPSTCHGSKEKVKAHLEFFDTLKTTLINTTTPINDV